MASNVIDISARRNSRKLQLPSRAFEAVSVHLSSIENRTGTSEDRKAVSEEISRMVSTLESELAQGGDGLRRHVEGYLFMMASGAPDIISPAGVKYQNPKGGTPISLEDGEAAKPEAKKKIDAIIGQCMDAAKSDLAFLSGALLKLDSGESLPEGELKELREILGANTYWRFFEHL
ncbi:MAG: hypothetical protein V1861_01255 [Candidatus Micrarchaeota archaeon]